MEGRLGLSRGVDAAAEQVAAWRAAGASHVSISSMGIGSAIDGHLAALADLAHAIGLPPRPVS
jgi:hypothetical protein